MDPIVLTVAVLLAWMVVAGVLALALGRAVAVAQVRERHAYAVRAIHPLLGVVATPRRSSIVRSR